MLIGNKLSKQSLIFFECPNIKKVGKKPIYIVDSSSRYELEQED